MNNLWENKVMIYIHQLLLNLFVEGKTQSNKLINHIDENKSNNDNKNSK